MTEGGAAMCRLGQEGGAPIGREVPFVANGPDAPDWQAANDYLVKMLGPEVCASLHFSRRQLSMRKAELIAKGFGELCRGK